MKRQPKTQPTPEMEAYRETLAAKVVELAHAGVFTGKTVEEVKVVIDALAEGLQKSMGITL